VANIERKVDANKVYQCCHPLLSQYIYIYRLAQGTRDPFSTFDLWTVSREMMPTILWSKLVAFNNINATVSSDQNFILLHLIIYIHNITLFKIINLDSKRRKEEGELG
jgi:hypothetical protein